LNKRVFNGQLVTVVQLEGDKIDAQLKLYNFDLGNAFMELESFVYSIQTLDGIGKEIVLHISSELKNNNTFFTDSNGLEM